MKVLRCSECGAPVYEASPDDEQAGVLCLGCADGISEDECGAVGGTDDGEKA